MDGTRMRMGGRIAALRKAKGLTQEQLADQLGVSAPAVSKWETDSSYPDITLLCPLARALGTNVDTLLQFEETLTDRQVTDQINALLQTALDGGADAGWERAEQQLEELLHRYPNCTPLHYNAAAVYDTFQMFFPTVEEPVRQTWRERKRKLLQTVRAAGNAAYWQGATIGLACLEIIDGHLEEGAALLGELPEHAGDPTVVWALYYQKKGKAEEALKRTQKHLYQLVSQTLVCLTTLINPKLLPEPEKRWKLCQTYGQVARAFGLPDQSDGFQMEWYLETGNLEQAAQAFARYAEVVAGLPPQLDRDLFAPGCSGAKPEGQERTAREMCRMLLHALSKEERYRPLWDQPGFQEGVERLRARVGQPAP